MIRRILVVFFLVAVLDVHAQRPEPTPAEEAVTEETRRPPLFKRIFGARTPVEERDAPQATPAPTPAATPRPPRATPTPPPTQVDDEEEEPRRPPLIRRIFGARTPVEEEETAEEATATPSATQARPTATPQATPRLASTPTPTPRPASTPTPSPAPSTPDPGDALDVVPEMEEEAPLATPPPTLSPEEAKAIYDEARKEAMVTEPVMAAKTKADASSTEAEHYENSLAFYDVLFDSIEEGRPEIASYVSSMRSAATRRLERRRDQMKEVFKQSTEISEAIRQEAEAE